MTFSPAPKPAPSALKAPKRIPARGKKFDEKWRHHYCSEDRVEWVKNLPCIACQRLTNGESVNAHIEPGGMGTKAHYTKIVPLCDGHHKELDEGDGREAFEQKYGFDLDIFAEAVEILWLRHLGQPDSTTTSSYASRHGPTGESFEDQTPMPSAS